MNNDLDNHPHEQNRRSWNAATRAHNSHKGDQAAFFRSGGSTLFPEERALLGDITGQTLVHLQCNAGQDTLSLARLGATVTGVDISDEAVDFATRLSADSGIPATFIRDDVYHWLGNAAAGEPYDIVFSSYGFVGWLSDLRRWARGISLILKPGGRFVCVEFHPVGFMFDENWEHVWPYSTGGEPIHMADGVSDYVGASGADLAPSGFETGVENFDNPHPSVEYAWGIGDLLTALLDAGLTIERFTEYPYSNGAALHNEMKQSSHARLVPPDDVPMLPLMFGLIARRPRCPAAVRL
jgi:SAM-dependent methyltransferase